METPKSQDDLSHEQALCAEPVYLFRNAAREFDAAIEFSKRDAEKALKVKEGSFGTFKFIRRAWNNDEKEGYFQFTYFDVADLDEAKSKDIINNAKRQGTDDIPNKTAWGDFIGELSTEDRETSNTLRAAIDYVRKLQEAADPECQPQVLHHHLLQLYSRFETRGLVPGRLYERLSEQIKNEGEAHNTCQHAFLTFTVDSDGELPDVEVYDLPTCERNGEVIEQPEVKTGSPAHFFTNYLVELFQPESSGGSSSVEEEEEEEEVVKEEEMAGRCSLWVPVYERYRVDEDGHKCPEGFFLGWLFQWWFPDEDPERISQILDSLSEEKNRKVEQYVRNCLSATELLAKEVQLANEHEASNADIVERSPADFLESRIHYIGNWLPQEKKPDGLSRDDALYAYDDECLTLDLRSTDIDNNPSRFEKVDPETSLLCLRYGNDFALPKDLESYVKVTCRRIRSLYRRLLYRRSEARQRQQRQQERERADRLKMNADLYNQIQNPLQKLTRVLDRVNDPLFRIQTAMSPLQGFLFKGKALWNFYSDGLEQDLNDDISVTTRHSFSTEKYTLDSFKEFTAAVFLTALHQEEEARRPLWKYLQLVLEHPPEEIEDVAEGLRIVLPELMETQLQEPKISRAFEVGKRWFRWGFEQGRTLYFTFVHLALLLLADARPSKDNDAGVSESELNEYQVDVCSEKPVDSIVALRMLSHAWGGLASAECILGDDHLTLELRLKDEREQNKKKLKKARSQLIEVQEKSPAQREASPAGNFTTALWKLFGTTNTEEVAVQEDDDEEKWLVLQDSARITQLCLKHGKKAKKAKLTWRRHL